MEAVIVDGAGRQWTCPGVSTEEAAATAALWRSHGIKARVVLIDEPEDCS